MRDGPGSRTAFVWHRDEGVRTEIVRRLRAVGAEVQVQAVGDADVIPRDAWIVVTTADPGENPVDLVRTLHVRLPRAALVVACRRPDTDLATGLMLAGAAAVIDLDASDESVAHGLVALLRDGAYVPRRLQASVVTALATRRRHAVRDRARIATLTPNERGVLELLMSGADRTAIAETLDLPPYRVRTLIDRAKAKLGVTSQRQAAAVLREQAGEQFSRPG